MPVAPAETESPETESPETESPETESPETESPETEPDPSDWDPTQALEELRKRNRENARLRARTKAAEEKAAAAERASTDLDALRQENAALKRDALRSRVALATGLPTELVARLQGDTEEEMTRDAETLLTLVAPRRPPRQRTAAPASAQDPADRDYVAMMFDD